jgi:hypothetical protein
MGNNYGKRPCNKTGKSNRRSSFTKQIGGASLVFTDSEILEEIGNCNPALVAIDGLLGFPDRDSEKV